MRSADYLLYAVFCLLYPRQSDFISGGLGIRNRARRYKINWERHFQCCREFQRRCLEGKRNLRVAVLGAGTMLDLDLKLFREASASIDFFDADPLARFLCRGKLSVLKRAGIDCRYKLTDITGRLDQWDEALQQCGSLGDSQVLDRLEKLPSLAPSPPDLTGYDLIVSLNLLSQIPIYWSDRLEAAFAKRFEGSNLSNSFAALRTGLARRLQQEHLDLLNSSGAKYLLILTDLYFFYYECGQAEWEVEEALLLPHSLELSSYRSSAKDSWLWHLAPQGSAEPEYGSIHQVQGVYYEKILRESKLK